jgi:hypothetical protein
MRRLICGAICSIGLLAMAPSAGAAPVIVGSPLLGPFGQTGGSGITATLLNVSIAAPGASSTSPVNGAIIRWHLLSAEGGPFRLRVLRPAGGTSYTAVGTSAGVTAVGPGVETFPTALPIKAGDTVGLDIVKGLKLGALPNPAAVIGAFDPILVEGSTQALTVSTPGVELGFNAEVQPAPTVTAVAPKSGSFKGGNKVKITGTDFATVSAVSFGNLPAKSFTVNSEGTIAAVAPRVPKPRKVDITVTTIAGTSTIGKADLYGFAACLVPRLNAKSLQAAKKKLKKAGCKVGKVTREDGVSAKAGKVVRQGPKPGKKLAPGTKVNVTLG